MFFLLCLVSKIMGEKECQSIPFLAQIIFIFIPNTCQLEDPILFHLLVLSKVGSWDVFCLVGILDVLCSFS